MLCVRIYALLAAFCAILEGGGMNTRKEFIREGFGLAAILAAQTAPAILVRSMVAARNGIAAAKRLSAKSYVQDGLVAMWDGIENAGWGVHDASATVWTALVGGINATKSGGTLAWSDDAAVFDVGTYLTVNSLFGSLQTLTLEVCHNAMPYTGSRYGALFSCVEAGGFGIQQNAENNLWRLHVGNPAGGYYSGSTILATDTKQTLAMSVGESITTFKDATQIYTIPDVTGIRYGSYRYCQIGRDVGDQGSIIGPIYSIRLYSRALTAAEIAANNAIDKERFNLT